MKSKIFIGGLAVTQACHQPVLQSSTDAAAAVWPEMYFTQSDTPTNTVHVVEAGRVSSGPAMGSGSVGKTACNFCREGTRYIPILYSVERTLSD